MATAPSPLAKKIARELEKFHMLADTCDGDIGWWNAIEYHGDDKIGSALKALEAAFGTQAYDLQELAEDEGIEPCIFEPAFIQFALDRLAVTATCARPM